MLVENNFFYLNGTTNRWELPAPTTESPSEVMRETLKHLATRSASDKQFMKLFEKLIEPPYGVPNGVIPLFVALAFRAEPSRIGIYHKRSANWERVDSKIAEAIVGMARFPDRYQTRYSKLSPKQRWIFRIVGDEFGVKVPESGSADKIEEACEKVAAALREFVHKLPEAATTLPDLSETQKDILKALRGGVPPQPTLLADHLMRWAQDDPEARQELEETRPEAPGTKRIWRDFRERLDRQVEGAKAPVRRQLQNIGSKKEDVVESLRRAEAFAGPENRVITPIVDRLAAGDGKGDLIEEIVAAVSGKEVRQLSQEDYGRASGMLEVLQSITPPAGRVTIIMPDGKRNALTEFTHEEALRQVKDALAAWQTAFSLTPEQVAAVAVTAALESMNAPPPHAETPLIVSGQAGT